MKVRYSRGTAISMLVVGVVWVFVGAAWVLVGPGLIFDRSVVEIGVASIATEIGVVSVGGLVLAAIGWAYLGRLPYFILTDTKLVVITIGVPIKKIALDGGQLAVDGDRLVIIHSGGRSKKLPVFRWYAHPDDWAQMVAAITQGAQLR